MRDKAECNVSLNLMVSFKISLLTNKGTQVLLFFFFSIAQLFFLLYHYCRNQSHWMGTDKARAVWFFWFFFVFLSGCYRGELNLNCYATCSKC